MWLAPLSKPVLRLRQPRLLNPCIPLTDCGGRPHPPKRQRSQLDTCKHEPGLVLLHEQMEIFVQKAQEVVKIP